MIFDNRAIGVFDSGLGGLTVVSELRKLLPNEDIIYLGDTARVPYGNKSKENIIKFSSENSKFLLSKNVKLILVACNTASALAMNELTEQFPNIPIIGVLKTGVESALKNNPNSIVVIGTHGTIKSDVYKKEILKQQNVSVRSIPCPLFVPIIEEGIVDGIIAEEIIELYLQDIKNKPSDVLILGCTHYPMLEKAINRYLGDETKIINSANSCANAVKEFINKENMIADNNKGKDSFFVTDLVDNFKIQASKFLGSQIKLSVEKVVL